MTLQSLRIVYLIGQLGMGGSERQLYLLLKHMDGERFDRHVVVFNSSPNYTLDDDLRLAGVTVHAIPLDCKGVLRRLFWIYKLLKAIRPHIIHSWSIHDNIYAGIVGKLAGVPRQLGSVRGSLISQDFQHFSLLIRWLILHSVQGHLVNSRPLVRELNTFGVPKKRVHFLPNCVEKNELGKNDLKNFTSDLPDGRLVCMVANLRREKNHILFIRGIARILPEFPDVYGIIIGQPVISSDPETPELIQSEIMAQGLQKQVLNVGFHANVPEILPFFELFCLTSDSEGTPNAVLEAMAAGLPVIATRVGGIPSIVQDDVTGLLIDPGDVDGFADALRKLLGQPEKAYQMGMAGRVRTETEFSCEVIVHDFEKYYIKQLDRSI